MNNIIPGNKQCNTLPQSILKNDIETSDKKEIAKTLNKFFICIGYNIASAFNFTGTSHINPPMNQNLFIFSHVTTSSVQKLFSSLDNNKATGLNGISVHTLGAGSPILMYYLTYLFNFSLYLPVMFLPAGRKEIVLLWIQRYLVSILFI